MRAVAIYEHGGPDVIRVVDDWPAPEPGPADAVVQVKATSLNRNDLMVRAGMPGVETTFPHVPGGDIAGVVVTAPPGRSDLEGARVVVDPMVELEGGRLVALGENMNGGMSEEIVVPADNLVAVPDGVTFEQAAALPMAYATAHRLLVTRGAVQEGEHVVVLGASGGLGTGAVQIAAALGAEVTAVASSPAKLARLEELGANHLIEATGGEYGAAVWKLTGKRGADVIVDPIGQATWAATMRTVAKGGRILVCGALTGHDVMTDLRYLWVREATIIGSDGFTRRDLEAVLALVASGRMLPVIDRVVGFHDVAAAQRDMEARRVFGKVIVIP